MARSAMPDRRRVVGRPAVLRSRNAPPDVLPDHWRVPDVQPRPALSQTDFKLSHYRGRTMLDISSLLVALTLTQAAPAAEQTARIAGRITAEGANTPIAGARIMLMPAARPTGPMGRMGMPPQALTDQDGRYLFDRVAAGSYRVNADKSGF